jgi:hypothetical protein
VCVLLLVYYYVKSLKRGLLRKLNRAHEPAEGQMQRCGAVAMIASAAHLAPAAGTARWKHDFKSMFCCPASSCRGAVADHVPLRMIWMPGSRTVGLCDLCVSSLCEAARSRISVSPRAGAAYAETGENFPPLMEAVALSCRVCMQRPAGRVCLGGSAPVPEQPAIRRGITASPYLCTRPQAPEWSEGTDYMPRRITCRPRLPVCHTELAPLAVGQRAPRENEATGGQSS